MSITCLEAHIETVHIVLTHFVYATIRCIPVSLVELFYVSFCRLLDIPFRLVSKAVERERGEEELAIRKEQLWYCSWQVYIAQVSSNQTAELEELVADQSHTWKFSRTSRVMLYCH